MSKLLVVLGATGNQGGSVIDTFLNEPGWKIRAVSRDANGQSAGKLKAKGVEVVSASLDDVSSLVEAFKGAYAIFSVTDFWGAYFNPANQSKPAPGEPMNVWTAKYEEQQGKNVFDAAAQTQGLERVIFSSLANATKWSHGKYNQVYHFDSKAKAAEYGQKTYPDLWKKTSIIQVGFYISNILQNPMLRPRKEADGSYNFESKLDPTVKLPMVAAEEDTGPFTKALLSVEPGKNLIAYREWMTLDEYMGIVSQTQGIRAKNVLLPKDKVWEGLPPDLQGEFDDNMGYFAEFGYEARDDPTLIHPKDLGVSVKLPSVEEWAKKQDWSAVFS